jgi:hypothetical protein
MKNCLNRIINLSIYLIFALNSIFAQNIIVGVSVSPGISKINTAEELDFNLKEKLAFSGNAGIFLEKNIAPKSSLGVELLFVQIQGKMTIKERDLLYENGGTAIVAGTASDVFRTHLSYTAIPLYYKYKIGKVGLKAGLQPMIFQYGSASRKTTGTLLDEPYEDKITAKDISKKKFDIGSKVGLDYELNNKFRLRADYYQGFTNVSSNSDFYNNKIIQISIGLQYIFARKNGENFE